MTERMGNAVVLVEVEVDGLSHAVVNAGLIATATEAYPECQIHFAACDDHVAAVRCLAYDHGYHEVCFHSLIARPQGRSSLRALAWYVRAFVQVGHLARRVGARIVFICGLSHTTGRYARLALGRLPACAVLGGVHNTDACLPPERTPRERAVRLLDRTVRRWARCGVQYVAYAPSLHAQISTCRGTDAGMAGWLHMPYLFAGPSAEPQGPPNRSVDFAFCGASREEKGFGQFCDLAALNAAAIGRQACRFVLIGGLRWRPPSTNALDCVDVLCPDNWLDRKAFLRELSRCDYAVFPYHEEAYAARTSGALFDAVACQVPIVANDIPFFRSYFDEFGDIGYLCKTKEAMALAVRGLVSTPMSSRHRAQQAHLARMREALEPRNQAARFRAVCDAGCQRKW